MTNDNSNKKKISYLEWYDILIVTILLLGEGIYNSTLYFLALNQGTRTVAENQVFTPADNYSGLFRQAAFLIAALIYLWLRRFDFRSWRFRLDLKAAAYGVLLFAGVALLFDGYTFLTYYAPGMFAVPGPIGAFFNQEPVSRVLYAILNGVYEELFFLGICLAVRPNHLKFAVPFSLLARFSFHTYQGLTTALGIGFLFGIYFYFFYSRSKDKNLIPFFIAHTIADIFGLSLIFQFYR